jgi:hypothetical protein
MSRKLSDLLLLVVLGLAVALVPIACSSDNGSNPADGSPHDAVTDQVTAMTPG